MEQYNQEYVAHNLPLIVLSGLPQDQLSLKPQDNLSAADNGIRLSSDLPLLSGTNAEQLLDEFLKTDGASHAWSDNGQTERSGLIGFKIATTGRVGMQHSLPMPTSCKLTIRKSLSVCPLARLFLHLLLPTC